MDPYEDRCHTTGSVPRVCSPYGDEEALVGFEDEAMKLLERLTGMHIRLDLISIVGMAGLGKTTLARKLYNDPYVVYHFHIRAWAVVSQVHRKRDILFALLSCILELTTEIYEMRTDKLCEFLRKRLMGSRYLIVMDDIWEIGAWDDLKRCFPDKNEGSRIIFTSRFTEIPSQAQSNTHTHSLRFLTRDESWVLLQKKVFRNESCPMELIDIGQQIATKCQGLPLAIVVIAGVLANEKTPEWWSQVVGSVSSYIVSDQNQYMETLTLSYNKLPGYLKPCFLYLGRFSEDRDISVQKLTWQWVAEGFIHQTRGKSMEDVAEEYLTDLINRSLVVVARRSFDGGIKACRLHDLLHDLSQRKADEENFRYRIKCYKESKGMLSGKLCIHFADCNHTSSMPLPLYASYSWAGPPEDRLIVCPNLKFLRVLDLSRFELPLFPTEVLQLVELRFLAVMMIKPSCDQTASISNLVNLETLMLLSFSTNMVVTLNLWKMVNLRHLYIKSGGNEIGSFLVSQQINDSSPSILENFVSQQINDGSPSILENLQTISFTNPSFSCQEVLKMSPNLRKLGVRGPLISNSGELTFPNLGSSNQLESLKLFNTIEYPQAAYSCNPVNFPERLKKLTLRNTALKWDEMQTIGTLENLEVLKLKIRACVGQKWETCDWGFRRLKFLKLQNLDIIQWSATSDCFPSLQRLVLHGCCYLEKIPSGLGDIDTLEMIEVIWCSNSVAKSAHEIQIEQLNKGNDCLKILTGKNWVS